jgi:hypothetical protein
MMQVTVVGLCCYLGMLCKPTSILLLLVRPRSVSDRLPVTTDGFTLEPTGDMFPFVGIGSLEQAAAVLGTLCCVPCELPDIYSHLPATAAISSTFLTDGLRFTVGLQHSGWLLFMTVP